MPNRIAIIGARSFVGALLVQRFSAIGWEVAAFTRRETGKNSERIVWRRLPSFESSATDALAAAEDTIALWISVAPIWVLPSYLETFERLGMRRIVAVSSTSRFTKAGSGTAHEREISERLVDGEGRLVSWGQERGVEVIILRPTLIYGCGKDKNISEIARFVRRYRFFPLFGRGSGLRQPVHADDVALACMAALTTEVVASRSYEISGGEVLTYREMVSRVFTALGRKPRIFSVPLWLFRTALWFVRSIPRYRNWSSDMAVRMNMDMVFDHSAAARDFGYAPRPFILTEDDLPSP